MCPYEVRAGPARVPEHDHPTWMPPAELLVLRTPTVEQDVLAPLQGRVALGHVAGGQAQRTQPVDEGALPHPGVRAGQHLDRLPRMHDGGSRGGGGGGGRGGGGQEVRQGAAGQLRQGRRLPRTLADDAELALRPPLTLLREGAGVDVLRVLDADEAVADELADVGELLVRLLVDAVGQVAVLACGHRGVAADAQEQLPRHRDRGSDETERTPAVPPGHQPGPHVHEPVQARPGPREAALEHPDGLRQAVLRLKVVVVGHQQEVGGRLPGRPVELVGHL